MWGRLEFNSNAICLSQPAVLAATYSDYDATLSKYKMCTKLEQRLDIQSWSKVDLGYKMVQNNRSFGYSIFIKRAII